MKPRYPCHSQNSPFYCAWVVCLQKDHFQFWPVAAIFVYIYMKCRQIVLNFSNLASQNGKMDGEWTDLPMIFSELWSNEVWYPLKYIKTGRFLDVFRRDRKRLVLWNGLGLVVKVPYSQSRGLIFKTTGWLQDRLTFSFFKGRLNEYQESLRFDW